MKVRSRVRAFGVVAGLLCLGASLACPAPQSSSSSSPARFAIYSLQTSEGPAVFRFDTATGVLSRAPLVGAREWLILGEAAAAADEPGRFQLDFAQAASIPLTFVRVDTQTGAAWRLAYPRERSWVAFRDEGEPSAAAPTPAAARPAAAAVQATPPATQPAASSPPAPAPGSRISGPNAGVPRGEDFTPYIDALSVDTIPVEMKAWAVEQLGLVDNVEAVPPLIGALDSSETQIVRSAIRALAHYPNDERVRPAIERIAKSGSPEVARLAETTLAKLP